MGFARNYLQDIGRRIAVFEQGLAVCMQEKMFSKVDKGREMTSTLKNIQDELRAEMSKNAVVRIKRGLSQDQTQDVPMPGPIAHSLEATPKPIKKSLFPSNAT